MGIPNTNFQPLIDLLSRAGEETTEFKKAQATSRMALIAFWLGVLCMIAESVAQSFGVDSRIGMIAGLVVTIAGMIAKVISSTTYTASRTDTKAEAASVAKAVIQAAPAAPSASVPTPPST